MKDTHKYNNNFKEYKKAIQFLEKGCSCGCSAKLPKEKFAKLRTQFQNLSKPEQDSFLMAQLINTDEGETTTSSRFPKRKRTNQRTFYRWNNKTPLCQETYFNMLGISLKYFESVKDHLLSKGLLTRTHGNTGRPPQWKTKTNIDQEIINTVKKFLLNYAEEHGLPSPKTDSIIFLPTETTYKKVHYDFIVSQQGEDNSNPLKYGIFLKLWHKFTPQIQIMKIRTDLCDTCQKFRRDLRHSCESEEEKELLKKNLISTETKQKKKGTITTKTQS